MLFPLSRLRGRAGVGVLQQSLTSSSRMHSPTRRYAPTSPASGRGKEQHDLTRRVQPSQDLVKLFEIAVADVHGAAGVAVIDADGEP